MAFLERIRSLFSSTPTTSAVTHEIQSSMSHLSKGIATYSCIAIVLATATTDIATAQTNQKDSVSVPKIEAVEQSEVNDLYEEAKQINADNAFTPEDLKGRTKHVKELKGDFDHVADEIQSLIDEGNVEAANRLLDVLEESVQNTHWNLTQLLRSAKEEGGEQDLIQTLESLVSDLGTVQNSIDTQRNLLAQQAGDLNTLQQRVADNPHASLEDKGDVLELRITGRSAKQSLARSKAVTTLDGLMNDLDLEGETQFDVDIPDEGDITVTTITTISLR